MHIVMQLSCKKCGYTWEYAGNKHRTSCSKCRTSITIYSTVMTTAVVPETISSKPPLTMSIVDLRLPLKLLDSLAFNRAKAWCKTNGEDYITLKADSEGILSL